MELVTPTKKAVLQGGDAPRRDVKTTSGRIRPTYRTGRQQAASFGAIKGFFITRRRMETPKNAPNEGVDASQDGMCF